MLVVLVLEASLVVQPTFVSAPAYVASVSSEKLEQHVRMLAETFFPRDSTAIDNLDKVADYIAAQFREAGVPVVSAQAFDEKHYRNIIGVIPGSGQGVVVVGAHYDTCGPLPGADDNASGVAVLIETARMLAHDRPVATIHLVAYPNEEPPFFRTPMMGSYVHAESLAHDSGQVRAMISLEMLGYYSDAEDSQHYPLGGLNLIYPRRGNFVAVIGDMKMMGLVRQVKAAMQSGTRVPVWSMNAPAFIEGIDFSDHQSYRAFNMPAIMVTDTAFFRNEAYHTEQDTADRLDYARMADVTAGVSAAVRALAATEQPTTEQPKTAKPKTEQPKTE